MKASTIAFSLGMGAIAWFVVYAILQWQQTNSLNVSNIPAATFSTQSAEELPMKWWDASWPDAWLFWVCGNAIVEDGEQCDPLAKKSCAAWSVCDTKTCLCYKKKEESETLCDDGFDNDDDNSLDCDDTDCYKSTHCSRLFEKE